MESASAEDISLSLQRFGVVDYVVFLVMLGMCSAIGVYYGFFAGKVTADEYLMGSRTMKTFPVAMSLIASMFSGITLLGFPTEIYLHGIRYAFTCLAVVLMGVVACVAYLPVLHGLRLTSVYEYLELRFSKSARIFGSLLFLISMITWQPMVMYVPALAFNHVSGVNVHIITPVVCIVCTFYTCIGGLKGVVWTDVLQTIIMFVSMLLVVIKGTMDIGGADVVWQRNLDSGRIEGPDLSMDPTERHSLMVLLLGGVFGWLYGSSVSQNMSQRFLSLPTMKHASIAMLIYVVGGVILLNICFYSGLLIYATYHDCDPLTTQLAKAKDQLFPLMVMKTLGEFPGMPGCFVAAVFSAALSTLSTALNSMAAVILEDFFKTFRSKPLTERQSSILMKTVVIVMGAVCVALVLVVEQLGHLFQVYTSFGSITYGPSLGIFSAGLFLPWVNTKGVLVGGATGLIFMLWIILGSQFVIAAGGITFETKPLTVDGCTYNFTLKNITTAAHTDSDVFYLYRLSYQWYTLLGCTVTMLVSLVVSFLTGANDARSIDHRLLSPVIRWFLPSQKPDKGYESVELHVIANTEREGTKKGT
ncbi:sodium-coupled monocarboxylate transporter 1 [Anabrus simplex]|uniref:sodium-coupled monocarboxylate transporter 1 n=1 Tax=Anabrus simplex TaxID=316456 RepID=UPI0035A33799